MRFAVSLVTLILVVFAFAFYPTEAQENVDYVDQQVLATLLGEVLRLAQTPSGLLPEAKPKRHGTGAINTILGLPHLIHKVGRR
ncbi:pigment-dispersing hormone type 1-like [Oratosquilla oratoria]|uniref:pigment-dispersing hormone type 1-like n=1 Tax=Oratosquilla oratoria TaxID=337810 RepID=UPI003F75E137